MHPFRCDRCGQTVHFENTRCERCGSLLGYLPGSDRMCAFDPAAATGLRWQPAGDGAPLAPCANRVEHAVCNWMLDEGDSHALCRSCRLTSVIPDLTVEGHLQRWAKIEAAKRRLVVTLNGLGLAPEPKTGADDTLGLSFELLADVPDGPPVLTGHAEGVITLNIAEADDVLVERYLEGETLSEDELRAALRKGTPLDGERRAAMSAAARTSAVATSWDAQWQKHEELFSHVAANRRAGRPVWAA
jgi:hypothetical protein